MSNSQDALVISKKTLAKWITGLLAVVIIVSAWFWWHSVYQNADNVFWGMIDNNLSLASITKHDAQTTPQGANTNQYTEVEFGALSASHGVSKVKQLGNTVSSETIGTHTNDYSRYLGISTQQKTTSGKPVDTSKFTGVWGKSPDAKADSGVAVQYFQQSVLGVVPFGNLTPQQRYDLVLQIKSDNTYDISQVKSDKLQGRPVYVYDISISPAGLIKMLVLYAKDIGLGDVGLDPTQYAKSTPVQAQFTVDKLSRQLIKVHYMSSGQEEAYGSLGLEQPIKLPNKTIPIADLQNRVVQSLK